MVFGGVLLDWVAGGYRQRTRTQVAMSVISIPSLLLLPWTMYATPHDTHAPTPYDGTKQRERGQSMETAHTALYLHRDNVRAEQVLVS